MPEGTSRVYWDTNVILSYLNGRQDRLPPVIEELLLRLQEKGQIELITSTVSRVEVAFISEQQDKPRPRGGGGDRSLLAAGVARKARGVLRLDRA